MLKQLLLPLLLLLLSAPASAFAATNRDCGNCTCAAGCGQICFVGTARTTCGANGLCSGSPECRKAAATLSAADLAEAIFTAPAAPASPAEAASLVVSTVPLSPAADSPEKPLLAAQCPLPCLQCQPGFMCARNQHGCLVCQVCPNPRLCPSGG